MMLERALTDDNYVLEINLQLNEYVNISWKALMGGHLKSIASDNL